MMHAWMTAVWWLVALAVVLAVVVGASFDGLAKPAAGVGPSRSR